MRHLGFDCELSEDLKHEGEKVFKEANVSSEEAFFPSDQSAQNVSKALMASADVFFLPPQRTSISFNFRRLSDEMFEGRFNEEDAVGRVGNVKVLFISTSTTTAKHITAAIENSEAVTKDRLPAVGNLTLSGFANMEVILLLRTEDELDKPLVTQASKVDTNPVVLAG